MLIFLNDTLEMLCSYAKAEYPKECCGILVGKQNNGKRTVYSVIQVENSADKEQSDTHFLIEPLEIARIEIAAELKGLEIVGFYHSHPNLDAIASEEDILHMIAGYSYPIISVKKGNCIEIKCFEKRLQTDTEPREEILIKEK